MTHRARHDGQPPVVPAGVRAVLVATAVVVGALGLVLTPAPPPAMATWATVATGTGSAVAAAMTTPGAPTAAVSGGNVTVTWAATPGPAGSTVSGYVVQRFDGGGVLDPSGPAGSCGPALVVGTSCSDTVVPSGTWTYRIVARTQLWASSAGPASGSVTVVAAPVVSSVTATDSTANGKIDKVTVVFGSTLGTPYSAGTTGWTLAGVPSGGTLKSVAISGTTATLTLNEGAGAASTATTGFTLALAATANGIRSTTGVLSSFSARAVTDGAAPVALSLADTSATTNPGGTDGLFQAGDSVAITFSEGLAAASVPATVAVSMTDPVGAGNDTWAVSGITNGAQSTGRTTYVSADGTATFAASSASLNAAGTIVTVTVAGSCTGTGCALLTTGTAGTVAYVPATTLTDPAGNAATGTVSVSLKLW